MRSRAQADDSFTFKFEAGPSSAVLGSLHTMAVGTSQRGGLQLRILQKGSGVGVEDAQHEIGQSYISFEGLLSTQDHEFEQRITKGASQEAHTGRIALAVRLPQAAVALARGLRTASRMQEVAALCARAGRHEEATALLQLSHQRRPLVRELVQGTALTPAEGSTVAANEIESASDGGLGWRLAAGSLLLKAGAEAPWPATLVELSRGAEAEFADLAVRGGRVSGGAADPFAVGASVMCQIYGTFTTRVIKAKPSERDGRFCYQLSTTYHSTTYTTYSESHPAYRVLAVGNGGVGAVLREAAAMGQCDLVCELLDKRVSPFEADPQGTTALHRAAATGQREVCQMLCQSGAVGYAANSQNLTAYDLAVQNQHVAVRRVFRQSAADRDLEECILRRDDPRGRRSSARDAQLDMWKPESEAPFVTPLMRAARQGNLERVRALITSEGTKQLHMRSKRRCTALLMAAEEGHVEVITALFEYKKQLALAEYIHVFTVTSHAPCPRPPCLVHYFYRRCTQPSFLVFLVPAGE